MSNFHNVVEVSARKQYKCAECCGEILVGEKYFRHSYVQDGDFGSYKLDACCEKIISEVISETSIYDVDNIVIGEIYEQFEFHDSELEWLTAYIDNQAKRNAKPSQFLIDRRDRLLVITNE